jgi:predicted ATPase
LATLPGRAGVYLPDPPTNFIGRALEVSQVVETLSKPECRLLTLLGPGGAGKTRLAIESARTLFETRSLNEARWVPLEAIPGPDQLPLGIADALRIPLSGIEDPGQQLVASMSDRECLLVLDNFEHLVSGAALLADLLEAAPGIKLLVTSRTALDLRQEWLIPVGGLAVGADATAESDALLLFAERVRQAQPDWSLEREAADIARICRLLEGMPLAIEIAASWMRMLTAAEVAAEIERSVDFLASPVRNAPERHRSMRAVFDHSWALLDPGERNALMRLSVFEGGFTRGAAIEVAAATLPVLSALLMKSLLQRAGPDRYRLHELLRQYLREREADAPGTLREAADAHMAYFARFVEVRAVDVFGRRQAEATREIRGELENIRAAWRWALETDRLEAFADAWEALSLFYEFQGRYLESHEASEAGIRLLSARELTARRRRLLGSLYADRGWMFIRFGRLAEAREAVERSLQILGDEEQQRGLAGDSFAALAILALTEGRYEEAQRLGEGTIARARASGSNSALVLGSYILGNARYAAGDLDGAEMHTREGIRVSSLSGEQWFSAYLQADLGRIERARGRLDEAEARFHEAYRLREEFDDSQGKALALNHLGWLALDRGEVAQAGEFLAEAQRLYQSVADRGGAATALAGLGAVACMRGDRRLAAERFADALEAAWEMNYGPLVFEVLRCVAQMEAGAGHQANALELVAFIDSQAGAEYQTRADALKIADEVVRTTGGEAWNEAQERGRRHQLDGLATAVLKALRRESESSEPRRPLLQGGEESAAVEALSAREHDILAEICRGATNQEIASRFSLSVGTVKWYTSQIYGKLGARNRTEAVARALESGLVD